MKSCTHNVHQLVLGADWACAHGDAGGLCEVVRQLSAFTAESLHGALTAIRDVAAVPDGDPFAGWASLRPALVEHLHAGGPRGSSASPVTSPMRAQLAGG